MNNGWTIASLTADQIVLARQTLKEATYLSEGSTFFKSGELCTVLNVTYDGVVTYQWPDGGDPNLLFLHPESDEQFCDWTDVDVPTRDEEG